MDFNRRTALVTGGTSGIGKAVVLELLRKNANVVAVGRNPRGDKEKLDKLNEMRDLTAQWSDQILFLQADVTQEKEVASMMKVIEDCFGGLDYLANIAGANVFDPIDGMDLEKLRRVFEINFFSKAIVTRYALPLLKKSMCPAIVNISSRMAEKPAAMASGYCCAEAATVMFTKACALELAEYKIRVNTVSPGRTAERDANPDEGMKAYAASSLRGRVGYTEDVAHAIAFLLSDEADNINGANLEVNGGILLV